MGKFLRALKQIIDISDTKICVTYFIRTSINTFGTSAVCTVHHNISIIDKHFFYVLPRKQQKFEITFRNVNKKGRLKRIFTRIC